jgi:hypothetical protein
MSGSAAARKCFAKITRRKYFCISQEFFLFILIYFRFDTLKNIVKVVFPNCYQVDLEYK